MNSPLVGNLVGQKFSRLTVLRRAENNKAGDAFWWCRCDCGKEVRVIARALRTGATRSCNCLQKETARAMNILPPGECAFNQLLNGYKWNARHRDFSFDLTKEQFRELTQGACVYCGDLPNQEIKVPSNNGSYVYNGIDRLDSKLGYTKDNCVSACGVHNLMKLDMTVEQFLQACQKVSDHQRSKRLEESRRREVILQGDINGNIYTISILAYGREGDHERRNANSSHWLGSESLLRNS